MYWYVRTLSLRLKRATLGLLLSGNWKMKLTATERLVKCAMMNGECAVT
jgi:hypothetical protein